MPFQFDDNTAFIKCNKYFPSVPMVFISSALVTILLGNNFVLGTILQGSPIVLGTTNVLSLN